MRLVPRFLVIIVAVLIPTVSIKATSVRNSEYSFCEQNFLSLYGSIYLLGVLNVAEAFILHHTAINKYAFFGLIFVGVVCMHILDFWHTKAMVLLYFSVLFLVGLLYIPFIFYQLLLPVLLLGLIPLIVCIAPKLSDRYIMIRVISVWMFLQVSTYIYLGLIIKLASVLLIMLFEIALFSEWSLRLYNEIENAVTSSVLNVIGEQCRALLILLFGLLGLVLCTEPPYGEVIMLVALGSLAFAIVRSMTKASRERI